MRHGLRNPNAGRAPGPSWHRQLVQSLATEGLSGGPDLRVSRGSGGTRLRFKKQATHRPKVRAVSLTTYNTGLVVTLRAGIMIMRGALIAVGEQSVTLASGTNRLWLQFSIDPGVAVTPILTKASAWPTLDLGTLGYWPLSLWTVTGEVVVLNTLYHPGGNIPYPVD